MEIVLNLNNQMSFDITSSEYNPKELAKGLNNPQVQNIQLGGLVVAKGAIMSLVPKEQVNPNIALYLNNGVVIPIRVDGFDPTAFTNDLNNQALTMIVLGNAIINKYTFMMVAPMESEEVIEE